MLTPADMPPGYALVISTAGHLYIEDAGKRTLFLSGVLAGRELGYEIRTVDEVTGMHGFLRGTVLFDLMMTHFRGSFDTFIGDWISDGTNLDEYNRLTALGRTPEDAARGTWTGRQLVRHGFATVAVFEQLGSVGRYGIVRTRFTK